MAFQQLLIDLGNSRLKWVWASSEQLDIASAGVGELADFEQACRERAACESPEVRLASVAGDARTRRLVDACERLGTGRLRRLQAQAEQGGVRCGYTDPARLGIDRWLALVGAVATYGKPVVVWDLGTAATLDAVDASGRHLGGLILPGPDTMRTALGEKTHLAVPEGLGDVGRRQPGRDTRECIVQGILAAQLGAAQWFLEEVVNAESGPPKLVLTGGAAGPLRRPLDRAHVYDPWLVFRGMLVD